ncbi:hypothetical protein LCGC14_1322830 [marine sediment metagenome]|uniref:Uncharacterized protein n=1 Tax=marine sediment metagenome TaxID=412755 RepID=A0A0F9KJG5_9ZZZZ
MRNKHRIIGLLLLGIIFINLTLISVFATAEGNNDSDNDGVNDKYEENNERNVEVDIFGNETRIISVRKSEQKQDQIVIDIRLSEDGIRIDFSYKLNLDSEMATKFSIVFHKIIEFNDTNLDNNFNPEIDQIIQNFSINTFQNISYSILETHSLHYIRISTINETFNLHLYLAEEFAIVEDQLISPAEMKMSVEISNFTYTNNNSRLGLYTKLVSEADFITEEETDDELKGYATNESGLNTTINDYTGFFTWNNYATVDEASKLIYVSDLMVEHEFGQKLYFSYFQGSNIYHDPKLGIKGILIPLPVSDSPTLIIVLVLTLGSVSTAAIYTIYHYGMKKSPTSNTKKDREKYFKERFEESEVLEPYSDKPALQILIEENSIENLLQIRNLNITVVSEDFFEIINRFEWEGNEKINFTKEMLSITPAERRLILDEMIHNASVISK